VTTTPHVPYSAYSPKAKICIEATRIAAMVDRLPPKIFSGRNSGIVQQAALDSFYVNVRLLIEFLEVRPAIGDVSASKTLPGWSTSFLTATDRKQLVGYHKDTSKHVVHFSRKRTNQLTVNTAGIRQVVDAVLAVWDEFAIQTGKSLLVPRRADLKKVTL
jgi:hypothetical protein